MLRHLFAGIGQTKVVEDGAKVLREAEAVAAHKTVTVRAKWHALNRSSVLHTLHRFPRLDETRHPLPQGTAPGNSQQVPKPVHKAQGQRRHHPADP